MKDYMLEQYENYMADNCTCDRSPEECRCLSFDAFCTMHIQELQDEWADLQVELLYSGDSYAGVI